MNSFSAAATSPSPDHHEKGPTGAVVAKARDLLEFARKHGYRPDDLVEIIENLV